jgi:XTP/dITP diphosphohydrolase
MTSQSQRVVLASGNAGKLRELHGLLGSLGVELVSQRDLGVTDADETGLSFVENAIIKARHACEVTGLPAIADDSGLEVDALNGEPGIYSARYAGVSGTSREVADAANNARLLERLQGVAEPQRSARFQCVIVSLRHAADPTPLICQGHMGGTHTRHLRRSEWLRLRPTILRADPWLCFSRARTRNQKCH